jgi:tetratricopeptide (TPR) repeat protein
MPSHIYLQLGMWPDVSAANERAWEASRAWVKRGGHPQTMLGWHSLQWLHYSYLQEGRYREAHRLTELARKILASTHEDALVGEPDAQFVVETMEFQYGAETGDWSRFRARVQDVRAFTTQAIAAPSIRERQRAVSAATHAIAALAGQRNQAAADEAIRTMRAMVSGRPADDPTRKMVETQTAQLQALSASSRGDRSAAVEQYRRLVGQASAAGIMPIGPPSSLPLAESLGAALMDTQQFSVAVSAYERALAERPNRSAALLGLARAKKAAGDAAGASQAYARLLKNWARADSTLPALAEARANLR